jgi:pimeloyl-ACP methyl ester carboxylesterase
MYVVALNEMMRTRNIVGAPAAALLAANPASRSMMLGGLHSRPWRVPAHDAAAEIKDFATAPGFHPTLYATTGSHAPTGLSEIGVPVRICFGTEDAMLGALTAARFVAAIPDAQLIPLPGCGHVPMADNTGLVARAIADLTLVCGPRRAG